jgi:hypothetical protein
MGIMIFNSKRFYVNVGNLLIFNEKAWEWILTISHEPLPSYKELQIYFPFAVSYVDYSDGNIEIHLKNRTGKHTGFSGFVENDADIWVVNKFGKVISSSPVLFKKIRS